MPYKENPKTAGSGIICCIPQKGVCLIGCKDCYFQSGQSYLEPLKDNLPNMPTLEEVGDQIVRVNDGNDSSHQRQLVIAAVRKYPRRFYSTSMPDHLEEFDAPVVLTVNPALMADESAALLDPVPPILMFVRVRVNTWNLDLVDRVVDHYSQREIPVVLTFMRYSDSADIPDDHLDQYAFRPHELNSHWMVTSEAWGRVMDRYRSYKWVYACGKDAMTFACHRCGNCLREYFYTMQKLKSLAKK